MPDVTRDVQVAHDEEASAANVETTIAPVTGKRIKILGFGGGSNAQRCDVDLKFESTVKDSLLTDGTVFGSEFRRLGEDLGVMAAPGQTVSVLTTPGSTGQCVATAYYRYE